MNPRLLCLIMIFIGYQNCSDIELVPVNKNQSSEIDTNPTPTPTPIPQASVKKALLCRAQSVSGGLRYYTEVLDFETGIISDPKESGNCASLVVADLDGDANDEWINTNSNSTINPCNLQVYSGTNNQLLKELPVAGTLTTPTVSICAGYLSKYSKHPVSGADTVIYQYEVGIASQKGMQIFEGIDLNILEQSLFPYFQSNYVFDFIKDTGTDGKLDVLSYTPGMSDSNGYSNYSFHISSGVFPINNHLHTWNLPLNRIPSYAVSLHHPTQPTKYLLGVGVQEMIPHPPTGGVINRSIATIVELYNSTYVKEGTINKNNILTGGFTFQYLFKGKADFNGDGREDVAISQNTSQYAQYTDILDGNNLNLLLKVDKAWIAARSTAQNISDQIAYLGAVDYNNDGKNDLVMKIYSFNNNKTYIFVVSLSGEKLLEKEVSDWSYSHIYGIKLL
jgi:hypothetical protein